MQHSLFVANKMDRARQEGSLALVDLKAKSKSVSNVDRISVVI